MKFDKIDVRGEYRFVPGNMIYYYKLINQANYSTLRRVEQHMLNMNFIIWINI